MLPEGWKRKSIEDIALVSSGGTPSRSNPAYWGGEIPWITTAEVDYRTIVNSAEKITDLGLRESSAKIFPPETILMAMYGQGKTRGKVAKLGIEAATNQACAGIQLKEGYSPDFYFQYLQSQYKNIRELSNSGGQENLSAGIVKSLLVPVPPTAAEQLAIANMLRAWDNAISTAEQLLANSRQQKKALSQQLLTGKKRFLGFDERWQAYNLSNVAEVIISPVDKKTEKNQLPVKLCNYTDVYYNNTITSDLDFMQATATPSEIEKYTLRRGDVVITKDSETPGDIAVSAFVCEELGGVVCGYHLAIIRSDNVRVCGEFIHYLLSLQRTRYYFFTLATGATRFGLSVGAIKKAVFMLPPLDEQKRIVSALLVEDQKVALLQKSLKRLKDEKSALMQQLLTGRRRTMRGEIR